MKHTPPRIRFGAAAFAALAMAATAGAATYYWKGGTGDSAGDSWSYLSNWSTEGVGGADATDLPGASDKFYGLQSRSIDLEGQEWSIGGWDSTGDWTRYTMNLWNGTLNVVGNVTTHSDDIGIRADAKLVFAAGTTFTPANWDGGRHNQYVHSGGEVDILGNLDIYNYGLTVYGGGTAVVDPTRVRILNNPAQKSFFKNSGGNLALPSGISFSSGSTSGDFSFSLDQASGTLVLGGAVTKNNQAGTYNATLSGGTVHATGDVSFDFTSATIPDNATLEINIDEGASFDLSGLGVGTGTYVTKSGDGDIAYSAGHMPETLHVDGGSLAIVSGNASYDLSGVTFSANGNIKIGATGISITGWDSSLLNYGSFVSGIASPVAGSTILTCANAEVLARAKAGLDATLPEGFATTINGNDLVVSSAYVFDSTTVTDLNDPAGWAGGSVPVGKVVTIMGAGVAPTTTALPAFAGITIQDGASLTVQNGGTLPPVTLADSAALVIASGTATASGAISAQPDGSDIPTVTVASGATLEVPGGTTFTDCQLNVSGTLSATTAGDLVLGYASQGTSASFGLTVDGGAISTTAGDIRFFCPASGGTVAPLAPVAFTGATFSHDNDHGFFFGVNNPTTTAIDFTFDGTTLNYPKSGYYTIAGGSALRFVNGASLYRANSQNDKFTLTVSGLASIFLGEGTTSLIGESSNSGGSVGNGAMTFSPDTDGFASLVVSNAVWETYHSAGNKKAVAQIYGESVHTINLNNWNRSQPFDGFKAVNLNDGATLTFTNNVDTATMNFSETFTGSGSLLFSTPRSTTRTFNFNSTASTATGTLSADADKPAALVIASTATWGGNVVWNGKASIAHSAGADAMTFGGIDLSTDFNVRVWGDGTCDHYTLTGAGFVSNGGAIVITVADGSEPAVGDSWTFARVPAASALPTVSGKAWHLAAEPVEGDETSVDLVLTPVSTDFTFNSTTVTDLSSPSGWSCGYVPANEIVKISGQGVTAVVSSAATFPAFASIAVRDGATLQVLDDVTLPPLTIDSTSRVVVGDNATMPAVSAVLDSQFTGIADATAAPVGLPVIEVATNATLSVASAMKFKNVDFRLYGTVTKASKDDYTPVFGYAENGETTYIAFTADGGVFDFHSNQSEGRGSVSFVYPASGGTVVPVGTIVLRNARRTVAGWDDFGNWEFGRANPTTVPFDVLADGTAMDASAYFYASGAAHLALVNGSYVRRNAACLGHWFPMAIQDSATVTIGEGAFIDFTTGGGANFAIDSQSAVDAVTVRDGGIYNVSYNSSGWGRGVFVADDGILGVSKLYQSRERTDLLRGFGSARLDGDLAIASVNIPSVGTGDTNWDRHTKMANIPFTGTGDVVVSNGVPEYPFSVTMVSGANTATGSIGAADVPGATNTLYFASGANWAGTVLADANVALTNLTDGAAAATVSFGGVQLGTGFALRLWQDGTSDKVNVGTAGWSGSGKVVLEPQDFADFTGGETYELGTLPSAAAALPTPANRSVIFSVATVGEEGSETYILRAKIAKGTIIVLR